MHTIFLQKKNIVQLFNKRNVFITILLIFSVFCITFFSLDRNCVAVVDLGRVYEEALVFQSIKTEQLEAEENWKKEALEQKELLEKADKKLSQKKRFLKKRVFDRRVSELKTQILDFQNKQIARLDLIRYQTAKIQSQVEELMLPMIEKIAQDRNLSFVLSSSSVLYYSKKIDLTDEVIDLLDESFDDGEFANLKIQREEGE